MSRSQQLAQRRAILLAECEQQRRTLVDQVSNLQSIAGWSDSGAGMVSRIKKIPLWIAGAVGGVLVLRPVLKAVFAPMAQSGRVTFIVRNGIMLWQLLRTIAPLIKSGARRN